MPFTKGDDFNRETGLLDAAGQILKVSPGTEPKRARYFYRLTDDRPVEFCVANACGPQSVETIRHDGTHLKWESYWEGDLLVFYPPEPVEIDHINTFGMGWAYDKRLQVGEPCPREEMERLSLRNRVSIVVPPGKA